MAIPNYEKTNWRDHIIDIETGNVIQQGTRFNQRRANNIEDGIEFNRNKIIEQERTIARLQTQLDLDGRAPGNSGSFSDTLDGATNKIEMQTTKSAIKTAVSVGATSIDVEDVTGFTALSQVTIYNGTKHEDVLITAIEGNTLTVQALKNSYSKGATVARSTVAVDTTNKNMETGAHITYSVELVEVA